MYDILVDSAYRILLGREPDPEGAAFWIKKLQDGTLNRNQFLYKIIQSEEFQNNKPSWLDLGHWEKCQELRAEIMLDLPIGKFCGPATDSSVFASIIQSSGIYEPHVAKEIIGRLKPGNMFIDIGANLGYFTLMASNLVGDSGKVISFEPETEAYNYCKKNMELNQLQNVSLYKYGLWSEKKTLSISASPILGGNHIITEGSPIECIPLDQLNLAPDLIKMDIEGAEPFALKGMIETLRQSRPVLLLELNRSCLRTFFKKDSEDIWDPLTELGYEVYQNPGGKKITSVEQLNSLCPVDDLIDLLAVYRH
jgi:FkbM family methyltransferase